MHLRSLIILTAAASAISSPLNVDVDWASFLSAADALWSWAPAVTHGYTVLADTLKCVNATVCTGLAACPPPSCAPSDDCIQLAAAACDACGDCIAFGLPSPSSRSPLLLSNASSSPWQAQPNATTWLRNGSALGNHSSVYAGSGAPVWWEDGPFVGNGVVGALLRVSPSCPARCLLLDIGRVDTFDRRSGPPYATGVLNFDKARLGVGLLNLTTVGAITSTAARMRLYSGDVVVDVNTTQGRVQLQVLAHAVNSSVILLQVNATGGESPLLQDVGAAFIMLRGNSTRSNPPANYTGNPEPLCGENASMWVCTQELLAGSNYAVAMQTIAGTPYGSGSSVTVMAVANDVPARTSPQSAAATVSALVDGWAPGSWSTLLDSHSVWWHSFYSNGAAFLTLPDTATQSFYWIQQYKLGSALRRGGQLLDLFGPWFERSSFLMATFDLNVEMQYSGMIASGRHGMFETLVSWLQAAAPQLSSNTWCGNLSSADAAALYIGVAYDGDGPLLCFPNGTLEGAGTQGNLMWTLFVVDAYVGVINDAAHAQGIIDTVLLPTLRRAVNLYLATRFMGSDGSWHLSPSRSPEYNYPAPVGGPFNDTTYDLALLRWSVTRLLQLNSSDPLAPAWTDLLARLTPVHSDAATGLFIGGAVPLMVGHRHWSHLFSLYPLHQLPYDDADGGSAASRALFDTSVDHWVALTCPAPTYACPNGFTYVAAAELSLLRGQRDAVLSNLTSFLYTSGLVHASTMYSEGRYPCIESPLGAATALQDMLVQSWGGRIRVFAGMPDAWANASFAGLWVDGGYTIAASRVNGITAWIAVTSMLTTVSSMPPTLSIAASMTAPISSIPAGVNVTFSQYGDVQFLAPSAGQTIVIVAGDTAPTSVTVAPLPANASQLNFWGKRQASSP